MGILGNTRRRKIIVDRSYQFKTTLVGIVYIAAAAAFLAIPLFNMMRHIDTLLEGHPGDLAGFYQSQKAYAIASSALFIAATLGAWTLFSLWKTHKIAGPLVKITRFVHQFGAGRFRERIVLRDKDQLHALAGALNDMASSLEQRDQAIQNEVLDQIEAIRCTLNETGSTDQAARALDRLSEGVTHSFETTWSPKDAGAERSEPVQS